MNYELTFVTTRIIVAFPNISIPMARNIKRSYENRFKFNSNGKLLCATIIIIVTNYVNCKKNVAFR